MNACYANQGPSQKRIRPAPMGRAFRVVKRTAHLTVQVAEKPSKIAGASTEGAPKRARGAAPKPKAHGAARRQNARRRSRRAKKTTSKTSRAKAATE